VSENPPREGRAGKNGYKTKFKGARIGCLDARAWLRRVVEGAESRRGFERNSMTTANILRVEMQWQGKKDVRQC